MTRIQRLLILAVSLSIVGLVGSVKEAAATFPCYACGSCVTYLGEMACDLDCAGARPAYCVGEDLYEYCSDPDDKIIQCGGDGNPE